MDALAAVVRDGNAKQAVLLLLHTRKNSEFVLSTVLLQNYLSLDAKDVNGDTALHLAVKRGNTTMIRYFLENGAGKCR